MTILVNSACVLFFFLITVPETQILGDGGAVSCAPPGIPSASNSFAVSDEAALRWTINGGRRVDYQLQESGLEAAGEYLAAIKAHNSYYISEDVASFILHEVIHGDQ